MSAADEKSKQSGPIKLPPNPQDALRALLQVKPHEKPEKGSKKGQKKPKPKGQQ